MRRVALIICPVLTVLLLVGPVCANSPVWPPAPLESRVEYVRQISLADLKPETSFLGKIGRFLGGGTPDEDLSHPFQLVVTDDHWYLTCQDRSALVVVTPAENTYQIYDCQDIPLISPIAMTRMGETTYLSDSGNGTVYRLIDDELEPWITTGLVRPTGLAAISDQKLIMVVDTGDHRLKFFDTNGDLVFSSGQRGDKETELNFPTFASLSGKEILVNDTLNFQIKRYDSSGQLLNAFGSEGDGPGTFARPKGVAVDADGNIWVVDALFDNVQVFNQEGRLLLVIGGPGQAEGEFWSPAGIAVHGQDVYIADTFNNRIQVLRYYGGDS